jgi:hypothetical protein
VEEAKKIENDINLIETVEKGRVMMEDFGTPINPKMQRPKKFEEDKQ